MNPLQHLLLLAIVAVVAGLGYLAVRMVRR